MSINSVDYDQDGDLDIYVCVGYPNDAFADGTLAAQGAAANRVYHDAGGAGKNSLFRNDSKNGKWSFVDVTVDVGLGENNDRFSFASSWDDFDNDGDPDLYVANDFGNNCLYENSAGTFREIAEKANAEDRASGMSVAWGDIDRDGLADLYVGNMFSSAGSRITSQPEFKPNNEVVRKRIQRFARGSTLLANNGNGTFSDISVSSATTLGRWAWSSNFADINNDGWEDILVANGYITAERGGDL